MSDPYIVAFEAGSSGRFISYILDSLLSGTNELFLVAKDNSAHLHNSIKGVDFSTCADPNSSNIYQQIKFVYEEPIKILTTHTFPNFDVIYGKYPNAKIIIISFRKLELLEITGNNLYKNLFSCYFQNVYIQHEKVEKFTKKIFKKNIPKEELTANQIQKIIETMAFWNDSPYCEPNISQYSNLLILPYHEIYNKNHNDYYIGLQKLEDFIGKSANEGVRENYSKYVKGRDTFISTKMPWLSKNDMEKPNN